MTCQHPEESRVWGYQSDATCIVTWCGYCNQTLQKVRTCGCSTTWETDILGTYVTVDLCADDDVPSRYPATLGALT